MPAPADLELPHFDHLLLVFGCFNGLEHCFKKDKKLKKSEAHEKFNLYLSTCPRGGTRSVQTEDALLITLTHLQTAIGRFRRQS